MPDFPNVRVPTPPVLTPFHAHSLGEGVRIVVASGLGAATSQTWPADNLALFYPFTLYEYSTAYQLLFMVGATSSGNIDVGIYDSQKNLVVSSGSTAMSATVNTVQELNIADTELPPGEYILGVACSTTVGTGFRCGFSDEIVLSYAPIYEQATALPLPDPCVPVVTTQATVPVFVIGIQFRSVF